MAFLPYFRRFMPFKIILNRINQNAIDNAAIFNKLFSLLFISKLIETLSEVSFDLKWDENKHFYTQKRIQMYNKECNTGYKYFVTLVRGVLQVILDRRNKQAPIWRLKMALKMSDICQNDRCLCITKRNISDSGIVSTQVVLMTRLPKQLIFQQLKIQHFAAFGSTFDWFIFYETII